tara:strand:- start:603 stop:1121 length:519 start_codon:yes stop_codon:yes gene_type:complete
MKSNIRSRWYRSNERPLESSPETGSFSRQAPFGEIDPSQEDSLKDDLSNAKPSSGSQGKKGRNSLKKNHERTSKPRRDNRKKIHGSDRNHRSKELEKKGEGQQDQSRRKNRPKPKKDHRTENGKNQPGRSKHRPNSKKDHNRSSKKKDLHEKPTQAEPKSGLSKFISKIFGG